MTDVPRTVVHSCQLTTPVLSTESRIHVASLSGFGTLGENLKLEIESIVQLLPFVYLFIWRAMRLLYLFILYLWWAGRTSRHTVCTARGEHADCRGPGSLPHLQLAAPGILKTGSDRVGSPCPQSLLLCHTTVSLLTPTRNYVYV